MYRHLVAVEVCVKRGADERVNADGGAFHEHWHERLDAESVQGWRAVEENRVILDHVGEHIPYGVRCALGEALRALDVVRVAQLNELSHHERLKEFERHLLRNTALVQLELWTNHDHGASGVVNALAEQVLAEATLLPLEHVAERLQAVVAGAGDGTSTSAVINEGVDCLLEHALLVAHDDLWRAEFNEALEAVVAVDDASIQVIEVRRGEASTVELHHWAQVWWDHREDGEDHPLRARAGSAERLNQTEALDRLLAAHAGGVAHLNGELLRLLVQVDLLNQFANRFSAHASAEDACTAWALAAELRVKRTEAVELVVAANFRKELIWLQAEQRLLLLGDLFLAALRRSLRVRAEPSNLAFGERLQVGALLLAFLVDLLLLIREGLFCVE